MKVSGFTFLRNAVINGYPFEESIRSILPIVDEFICVIGEGEDETRDRVVAIADPKILVIDSHGRATVVLFVLSRACLT